MGLGAPRAAAMTPPGSFSREAVTLGYHPRELLLSLVGGNCVLRLYELNRQPQQVGPGYSFWDQVGARTGIVAPEIPDAQDQTGKTSSPTAHRIPFPCK